MTLELTPRIISSISREMNHGRALWAMLTANEYIGKDEALRKVLANKAKKSLIAGRNKELGNKEFSKHLLNQVLAGKTLAELSESEQTAIKAYRYPAPPRLRKYEFKAPKRDFQCHYSKAISGR